MASRRTLAWLGPSLIAAACGCGRPPASVPSPEAAQVRELRVERGDFEKRLVLTGELEAARGDPIAVPRLPNFQVSIKWLEEDGASVRQGQRIAELDNASLAASLREKESAEIQAEHDLAKEEAQQSANVSEKEFEVARRGFERDRARVEAPLTEGLQSRREQQEKRLALERAEAELEKAKVDLAALRKAAAAELANRRLTLEKTRREIRIAREAIATMALYAPRSGILIVADHPWEGRKLQAGDLLWVGSRIASVPDLTSLQVIAQLSDVDDRKIRFGQPAVAVLDAYPDRPIAARLAEIAPVASEVAPQSLRRAFRVVAALDHIDPRRMRPGHSVRLEISTEKRSRVLLVPREALDFSRSPVRARLRDGRTAAVRLGPCNSRHCILEAGLPDRTELAPSTDIGKSSG